MSLSSNKDFSLITNVDRKPNDTKSILNFHAACPYILESGFLKRTLLFTTTGLHLMKKFLN